MRRKDVVILPFAAPDKLNPIATWVSQSLNAGGWTTAISRSWPEGISHHSCGRCPIRLCTLAERHCLVVVNEYVSDGAAIAYSLPVDATLACASLDDLDGSDFKGRR